MSDIHDDPDHQPIPPAFHTLMQTREQMLVSTAPPTRWRNWFRVFEMDDSCLTNNGTDITPGVHEDVNLFASRDEAETFAREQVGKQPANVRQHFMWLGAFPDGETP